MSLLIETLSDLPFQSAIIEAGHFYADKGMSPMGDSDVRHAMMGIDLVSEVLRNIGGKQARLWWFIDEMHQNDHFDRMTQDGLFSSPLYEEMKRRWTLPPDNIVFESEPELQQEALNLVDKIPGEWLINMRKGISLVREGMPNYILCKKDSRKKFCDPSCSLLDAALYVRKSEFTEENGVCITILPEEYRSQQDTTKLILKRTGYNIPILNVYFNKTREVSLDFSL